MATQRFLTRLLLLAFALGSLIPSRTSAQVSQASPRITQAVNETRLTVLRGNIHPLARPQFDRGPAPASLPMDRMLLVLKRSPEQEAALEEFMAEQQDPSSPNFHNWLSPQEFGQRFGPAGQDIQTITSWLALRGFRVESVSKGRTVIEFSGTAAEVQGAFHTTIHKYVLPNGEQHWANASDPAIPAALAPVVTGVSTLHNFFPKPMSHVASTFSRSRSARPQFTFIDSQGNTNFVVGPADFATIYNVTPLWDAGIDGTGQTIAIVSDSNINLEDARDFRSIFGLPAKDPKIIVNGSDPGLTIDEVEAIIDVEWSGAVAKNAQIDLVVSPTTNTTFGGDLSAIYVLNNNLAPILSVSFGQCELFLGTAQNAFYYSTWQQAAAQGITVSVSTGDDGSAGCDFVQGTTPAAQPATGGLAVNGLASTPFNVAVGGTEFNYSVANPLQFWSSTNTPNTQASALSYIPEETYNDSCTNAVVYTFFGFSSAEAACNDPTVQQFQNSNGTHLAGPVGGSGGASSCIISNGSQRSSCAGGYPKPSWQTGTGVPNDGKRDLPDISLFAGDGTISGSAYVVCNRDFKGVNNAPCSLTNGIFLYAGGTSVSAQAFAGIMALLDQKYESRQGLINPLLYSLAATGGNTCASATNPPSACIFYDLNSGTISMPCSVGTPDCLPPANSSNTISVLSGVDAGTGYDLATGLGSVNAANLVSAPGWTSATGGDDFSLSLSSPAVTVSRGGSGAVTLTITGNNGYAGTINFTSASCSSLPAGASCSFSPASVTGTGSTSVTISTTAPSVLIPLTPPNRIALPAFGAALALVGALSIFFLLLRLCYTRRRWSIAAALVAFALVFVIVGCSGGVANNGGGGGGGNSGTPVGTTAVVITAKTAGATPIQRSATVTLTVN